EVERHRAHPGVERADLAEHAGDGRVARRDLQDDVDVLATHFTRAPGGRSRSGVTTASRSPADPASTMPWDSIPMSLAASRLATSTNFLPTSSPGGECSAVPAATVRWGSPSDSVSLERFFDLGTVSDAVECTR